MLIGGEKEGDSLRIREYRKEDGPVLAKLFRMATVIFSLL